MATPNMLKPKSGTRYHSVIPSADCYFDMEWGQDNISLCLDLSEAWLIPVLCLMLMNHDGAKYTVARCLSTNQDLDIAPRLRRFDGLVSINNHVECDLSRCP